MIRKGIDQALAAVTGNRETIHTIEAAFAVVKAELAKTAPADNQEPSDS